MCQISIQILKQYAIPNLGLQSSKIYSSKGYSRKTKDRWTMYVAETAILKLRILSGRYHFRLFFFASTDEYFYYNTEESYQYVTW